MTFFVLSVFPAPDSPLEALLTTKGLGNKTDHNIRDENTLIFTFFTHINPSAFSDREDVWGVFISTFVAILLNNGI